MGKEWELAIESRELRTDVCYTGTGTVSAISRMTCSA
jgi:hypothetical protein